MRLWECEHDRRPFRVSITTQKPSIPLKWNPHTKRRKSNIPLLKVHFHQNCYNLHRILNSGKWNLFGGICGIRILNGGNRLFLCWKFSSLFPFNLLQFTSDTKRRKVDPIWRKMWNPRTKRRKSNIPLLEVHFHSNCFNLHRILNGGKWNLFGGKSGNDRRLAPNCLQIERGRLWLNSADEIHPHREI